MRQYLILIALGVVVFFCVDALALRSRDRRYSEVVAYSADGGDASVDAGVLADGGDAQPDGGDAMVADAGVTPAVFLTVTDWSVASGQSVLLQFNLDETIGVNGDTIDLLFIEGIDFVAETSNEVTAQNIGAALNSNISMFGWSLVCNVIGDTVYVTSPTYVFLLFTSNDPASFEAGSIP